MNVGDFFSRGFDDECAGQVGQFTVLGFSNLKPGWNVDQDFFAAFSRLISASISFLPPC